GAADRLAAEKSPPLERRLVLHDPRDLPDKLKKLLLLRLEVPVEPGEFVVLAIGVIVALLRATGLVPGEGHRTALGEEQRRYQIAFLPLAEGVDARVVGRALGAAVPGVVVVSAVAVILAVGLVVLAVVADQVLQREAVVAGDEIDRRVRL